MPRFLLGLLLLGVLASACGADRGPASADPAGAPAAAADAAPPPPATGTDGGTTPDGAPAPGTLTCTVGASLCVAHDRARRCVGDATGSHWVDETCPAGSGCANGACTPGACSDECVLGDASGGKTCALLDVKTGTWIAPAPATSLHDRARDYVRGLRKDGLAAGGVGIAVYADPPTYSQLASVDDIGDSALWTGSYLAAEALRLRATGAPEARDEIRRLVATLHDWFGVTGSPGVLARFAIESSKKPSFTIGDLVCTAQRTHCGVPYAGKTFDYIGHVSRDQYQGVVLGYQLAYEALSEADEDVREIIRGDMFTLVEELMKERQVPLRLKINGTQLPPSVVNARFIVVHQAELVDGALDLEVDTNNTANSEMYGFQEFAPDLADLVHELPGLAWVPPLPRPSSAIMLASFFQVAMSVSDGVPAYKSRRDATLAYYTGHTGKGGNVKDWLAVAEGWAMGTGCGGSYFANNITMMPMYDLARLETDPARKAIVVDQILGAKLWPAFQATKNVFFSFIYAGASTGVPASVTDDAATQLAQFPVAPRLHRAVDLRNDPRYPHDAQCANQVDHSMATDVADRTVDGFLWQRDSWELYDPGNPAEVMPGVDYLVAYWLGRRHGFLKDDSGGSCLAWRP